MLLKVTKHLNISFFWCIVYCQLVNRYQSFRRECTSVFDYPELLFELRCIFVFVDLGGGDVRHTIFANQHCIDESVPIPAKRTSVLIWEHGARICGEQNSEKEIVHGREEVAADWRELCNDVRQWLVELTKRYSGGETKKNYMAGAYGTNGWEQRRKQGFGEKT